MRKEKIRLVPLGDPEALQAQLFADTSGLSLQQLLQQQPALSMEPIPPALLAKPLEQLRITVMDTDLNVPLYRPMPLLLTATAAPIDIPVTPVPTPEPSHAPSSAPSSARETPREQDAVTIAYTREIEEIASFLRMGNGLSVLIYCEKIIVQHLWAAIVRQAGREPRILEIQEEDGISGGLMPQSLRQRQLDQLKQEIAALKIGQVLVIPHLDLLAGGAADNLSNEARELTELLYNHPDRLLLAFADRSLAIPEVLATRFSVRRTISGVSRTVIDQDGSEKPLGEVFVSAQDTAHFSGFAAADLYKNVAGMNPIQILHAIRYATQQYEGEKPVPVQRLYQAIRAFKVQNSVNFEIPDVGFDDIGGYEEVKAVLAKAIELMTGAYDLPDEALRRELIPRGFIFYGPPGTGKTLFAKAIANKLNATVQVVSGPEVMDMYVGESERKIREYFAEARRNAPSVLIFDEFDALASKRSGRDDGGSRAGNAVVAQMLTEMDGFRADVPMLVIGTTNRIELIDSALLRPSRFQAVPIHLPAVTARRAIAAVHAKHFKIEGKISATLLEVIAEASDGFNGDEIRSLFRDACVGLYCENPPRQINAQRLGELIGNLRHNVEMHITASSSEEATNNVQNPSPAPQTPGPTSPMNPL